MQMKINVKFQQLTIKKFYLWKKARHPFIDKDKVVPLTFEIGKDYDIFAL